MSGRSPSAPSSGTTIPGYADTIRAQLEASDPAASAWVSANAGTGKTHVLTTRVIRLLLSGAAPERILCLTYTKAAAAEMAKRVLDRLAGWVTLADDRLDHALAELLDRKPTADERLRARQLFATAIETPGGLKVQTIHAFCERLLQRFPLEAGVPPGFTTLDEAEAQALFAAATDQVLAEAAQSPGSELAEAVALAARYASDERFDNLLGQMMRERAWLDDVSRAVTAEVAGAPADAGSILRQALGLPGEARLADIEDGLDALLPETLARDLVAHLATGSSLDQKAAGRLLAVLAAPSRDDRHDALTELFLTTQGEPRKRLMTKAPADARPDLLAAFERAQSRFIDLHPRRIGLLAVEASLALARIADAVHGAVARAKADRAALDFNDLIRLTGSLLATRAASQWVLYKLDGGLDHILVDEAQDTSPEQWRIVMQFGVELLAGREGHAGAPRTVFAVGDEKQSIYGFQGAAPHMLAAVGAELAAHAQGAGRRWRDVPLVLSFRTVAPVLDAVDATLADPHRTPGVSFAGKPINHRPHRIGEAGVVEVWELERPDESREAAPFDPLGERASLSPAVQLARRIGGQIEHWLRTGERLVSENRPITAGDILILVRRRRPFADTMVAELKRRGIPVAGTDRLRLSEHIAVRDLVALGDVLLLPEDDLALAALLKSPLIGLDDDDLIRFAPERRGTLWSALLRAGEAGDVRLASAAETIKRWRRKADFTPPFELYSTILDAEGGRRRFLDRLGPEAGDVIDAFLDVALGYDERHPPSLQGLLGDVRASGREIKRDMSEAGSEVRVMTVHGAKGLEAPIVFLPDTCSTRSGGMAGGLVTLDAVPRPPHMAAPVLWPVRGARHLAPVAAARSRAQAREAEERNRLLYVAMTRARDRLYIAGFAGRQDPPAESWYVTIRERLQDRLAPVTLFDGAPAWRWATPQTVPARERSTTDRAVAGSAPPPPWATARAPRELGLVVPFAPSRLASIDIDADGDPIERLPARDGEPGLPPLAGDRASAGRDRFLRGTLTHALLQHLPSLVPEQWEQAATQFVAARAGTLGLGTRASIVAETLAILRNPLFAPVFGAASRAEVALAALVEHPDGMTAPLSIAGQIDRLVVCDGEVLIVDFKTNRPPPREVAAVPLAYLLQLAAYRLAVARIHPDHTVRAALVWTDGPQLMAIPHDVLDAAEVELWQLAASRARS